MRKKGKRGKWQVDNSAIYRVMTGLQPFTQSEQDQMNLPVRMSLQCLKEGTADEAHINTMAVICNVCLLRAESIGGEALTVAKDGQDACMAVIERHQRTGYYSLTGDEFARLEVSVDMHEQLYALSTPIQMIQAMREVVKRVDRGLLLQLSTTARNG